MKRAISHITTAVHGSVASVVVAPGDQVDLDQVVGHQDGKPVTLGAALGPHVDGFTLVTKTLAASRPRHGSPSPVGESEKE